jgi:hypothetical protein
MTLSSADHPKSCQQRQLEDCSQSRTARQPADFLALPLVRRLTARTSVHDATAPIGVRVLVLRLVRVWVIAAAAERKALCIG